MGSLNEHVHLMNWIPGLYYIWSSGGVVGIAVYIEFHRG